MRSISKPHSFAENIERTKRKYESELDVLADGPEREMVVQKIAQLDNARRMDGWLRSSLRAPT